MSGVTFIAAFLAYIAFLVWLSWFVSRSHKSGDDFLLSGRNVPFFLTLGTTVATMVGTGSSMGAVGFAYTNGWAGTLYGIGGALGILALALFFSPVRRLRFMTMSEELSYYVGANVLVKNIVAVLIFFASIGWLGAHIIGGGLYLSWVAGIDVGVAKMIVAVGFAVYVIIGGYTAVVWTDTIQAIILFVGFILMAILSIKIAGGWDALTSAQSSANLSLFAYEKIGLTPAISLAAVVMVGLIATPSYRQRIYSGKNLSSVRNSFIAAGMLYLAFSFVPALVGMSAFALNPGLEQESFAFPYLALEVLPVGVGVIVLIAGLSATMSSASSDAIAAVAIFLRDISEIVMRRVPKREHMLFYSRISVAAIIVIALSLAMLSSNIIDYITRMISTVLAGMFVCSVLGRFWPRYNWQGAIVSLVSASTVSLLVISNENWLTYWGNPVLPAVSISTVLGVVAAICTPKSKISNEAALKKLSDERSKMEAA